LPIEPYGPHFGRLAGRYDELRRDPSARNLAMLVEAGDLAGRRVLDIGCGTGRVALRLQHDHGARVTGIDPSQEMLGAAREWGLDVRVARAEHLPFPDGAFERALMQMVLHLTVRSRALAEARRVLEAGGRLAVCTLDPAEVEEFWLARWFPSYPAIDRARFPAPHELADELRAAGFAEVRTVPLVEEIVHSRQAALEQLRGRFASSFALIPDDEYQDGLRRAEAEMPDPMRSELRLAILSAAA
jgi:SAM-dependent methyltransferase